MKKLFVLAVIAGLIYQFKPEWIPFTQPEGAYYADGSPKTLLFTFSDCKQPCAKVKDDLQRRGASFEEVVVDANAENRQLWDSFSPYNSFPLLIVGKERAYGDMSIEVATTLALNYGDGLLTSEERELTSSHFNADGSPRVVMYSADWCPYCKKLRGAFRDDGMAFKEIDVEKARNKEQLIRTLGISGYPVTYVGYRRVVGDDIKAIKKALASY
ncbi:glutaredoxin domain-containing protein [Hahella aquimaris]|uniref:glutaredoxin domain-containing protein n=1 Tax=Hahella sp. HNIBRBA332 TaxID=3015983 RepID=UPI00273C6A1B|nr:glutaredoxin domain-containing protein [Hahella sp. HNIBRBA332]WLQ17084.1 glutaredoxin domain-containing protein [Hahella sp. HNIBRBA332]